MIGLSWFGIEIFYTGIENPYTYFWNLKKHISLLLLRRNILYNLLESRNLAHNPIHLQKFIVSQSVSYHFCFAQGNKFISSGKCTYCSEDSCTANVSPSTKYIPYRIASSWELLCINSIMQKIAFVWIWTDVICTIQPELMTDCAEVNTETKNKI